MPSASVCSFDRHGGAVRAFCARRTGSIDAADDLVSIVFLEAWRRRVRSSWSMATRCRGCTGSLAGQISIAGGLRCGIDGRWNGWHPLRPRPTTPRRSPPDRDVLLLHPGV
ncbi:RNA polymerase sigma factor [Micromonospora chalcea]|uniref:RNA polymerase sigma factor n=1 Tax=Micromonospora chalcea TaxID=1874 RepID=UPI003815F97E